MIPTAFDGENTFLDKPKDMTVEQCAPLSCWIGELSNGYMGVVSCWKLTKEELIEVNRTGRVWVTVLGDTMSPIEVNGFKPEETC